MGTLRFVSMLAAFSVLLAACGGPVGMSVAQSQHSRVLAPDVPPDELAAVVQGNNTFAVDLYQALRAQDDNLVFSPFSVSLALAMTYAGARGETEAQMARALHFDLPQERLHRAFNALDLALEAEPESAGEDSQPLQLNIANAVWAEQTYSFRSEFLDTIALNYGAGVHLADFLNAAESARREINLWVSDRTGDRIQELIAEGALDHLTRLVLVNAIYFKADWSQPFDPDSTRDSAFHRLDGSQVDVPTMNDGLHLPYAQGDGWQAVELSYVGETAAMDIIVPDQGRFEELESSLDGQSLEALLTQLEPTPVQLSLPKFEFTTEASLVEPLQSLGMRDAFDADAADLTGMTEARELYVTDVLHQAFVAVDEDGTEAAAATAVIVGVTSAPLFDVTLTIDRPFIFLIRDLQTGQILFMGRVLDPSG